MIVSIACILVVRLAIFLEPFSFGEEVKNVIIIVRVQAAHLTNEGRIMFLDKHTIRLLHENRQFIA